MLTNDCHRLMQFPQPTRKNPWHIAVESLRTYQQHHDSTKMHLFTFSLIAVAIVTVCAAPRNVFRHRQHQSHAFLSEVGLRTTSVGADRVDTRPGYRAWGVVRTVAYHLSMSLLNVLVILDGRRI
ncbi:hypothetical protein BJ170DRAFT_171552 [Xylariales sp. AK1849]|nr:hypothetical protein BJ170DRAFT_171552 [Xylariales sp. AK1849]